MVLFSAARNISQTTVVNFRKITRNEDLPSRDASHLGDQDAVEAVQSTGSSEAIEEYRPCNQMYNTETGSVNVKIILGSKEGQYKMNELLRLRQTIPGWLIRSIVYRPLGSASVFPFFLSII